SEDYGTAPPTRSSDHGGEDRARKSRYLPWRGCGIDDPAHTGGPTLADSAAHLPRRERGHPALRGGHPVRDPQRQAEGPGDRRHALEPDAVRRRRAAPAAGPGKPGRRASAAIA